MKNSTIFGLLLMSILFMQCEDESELCCPACPIVESISASTVTVGDTISIRGKNFGRFGEGDNDRVEIGGIPALVVGTNTDTHITVEITEDAVGGEVVVYSANAAHATSRNTLASNLECLQETYPTIEVEICNDSKEFYLPDAVTSAGTRLIDGTNIIVASDSNGDLVIYFIDDEGNILHSVTHESLLPNGVQEYAKTVTAMNDGGFTVINKYDREWLGNCSSRLTKFDALGTLQWTKYFEGNCLQDILSIGSDMVIAGTRNNSTFTIKLNRDGDVYTSWQDESGLIGIDYKLDSECVYSAFAIEQIDNELLMLAYQIPRSSSNKKQGNVLLKLDMNGNFINILEVSNPNANDLNPSLAMIKTVDNKLLLYGEDFTMMTDGHRIAQKLYLDVAMGTIHELSSMDNEYIIVGKTNNGNSTLIAKLSTDRKTILDKRVLHEYNEEGYNTSGHAVHKVEDGSYFIFGSLQEENQWRPYYAIVDCMQ